MRTSFANVIMQREEDSTYDPEVHGAPWHNDNPFVVEQYRKRLKKCRGCATLFVNCNCPTPKFVISHYERRVFWTKYGRRESMQKVFYHCSRSCVKPRHPYFKSRELTIVPSLVDEVTADDIELAKRHGVDLSFVTLKDTE